MMPSAIQNLILNLLTTAFGALVTKGLLTGSQSEAMAGGVLALLVWGYSHLHFKKAQNSPPPAPGGTVTRLLLVALLCLPASFLLPGCKNPSAAAYSAVNVTTVSAQEALKGWNAYVVANHPPASQSLAVRNAYAKYQAAELAAFDAAQIASDVASSTNSTFAALEAEARTQAAAQALTDLVALVRAFGVTL